MQLNLQKLLVIIFSLVALATNFLFPTSVLAQENQDFREEILEGTVTKIIDEGVIVEEGQRSVFQKLEVKVDKGSLEGRSIVVDSGAYATASDTRQYKAGDKLVISYAQDAEGADNFIVIDYVRRSGLYLLFAIFIGLTALVGGLWGVSSLIGMVFSFLVIFAFILPQIINGADAVLVTIIGSAVIMPVTFTLSHGLKRKTFVAVIGTVVTLVVVGVLASVFVDLTHLSGFAAEEAGFLQFEVGNINMKGILLAGFIIASLGILDDITISQSSVVEEIRRANSKLKPTEVFARAMRVGRDHIASLVNTLVLVYTGASLPLLLLFVNNPRPFSEVINYEIVADEVVRMLVGSIGLILAVPITTAIAAFWFNSKDRKV